MLSMKNYAFINFFKLKFSLYIISELLGLKLLSIGQKPWEMLSLISFYYLSASFLLLKLS